MGQIVVANTGGNLFKRGEQLWLWSDRQN